MLPEKFGNSLILIDKIASGGMGEVFKAKQIGTEGFEKTVAVKRVLPHFSSREDFSQLFKHEMWLAAQLQHSNIAQVFSNGTYQNYLYLVMEYVSGCTLAQMISTVSAKNDRLSIQHCCYIISEIAKGLHYAHTRRDEKSGAPLNIVHRDVTPQNIMCSEHGEVKILDFGIAKVVDSVSDISRVGDVKGKLQYVSPEQLDGRPASPQSDVFALGIVMFELLAGQPLFLGQSPYLTINNILNKEPTPVSDFREDVHPELDAILARALAKEPSKRYTTAEDMHRALSQFLSVNFPSFSPTELGRAVQRFKKEAHGASPFADLKVDERLLSTNVTQSFDVSSELQSRELMARLTRVLLSIILGTCIGVGYSRWYEIEDLFRSKRPSAETLVASFTADTIIPDSAGKVAHWPGSSPRGPVNFSQSDQSHRPTLITNTLAGHSVVKFEGNQFLSSLEVASYLTGTDESTFFFVVKLTPDTLGYLLALQQSDLNFDVLRIGSDDSSHIRIKTTENPSVSLFLTSRPKYPETYVVLTVVVARRFVYILANGSALATGELPNRVAFRKSHVANLGMELDAGAPTDYFRGELAELMIFDSVLDDEYRNQVLGNLLSKYQIPLEAGSPKTP